MLSSRRKPGEQRRAARRPVTANAYIRMDGFAVRPCVVLDRSDSGFKITIDGANLVPKVFIFLETRNAPGRKAAVKWRRGAQIGAQFL